ncbi:MAG: lysophospholipid acyltransferase family protein [Bacteroidales bacterium]
MLRNIILGIYFWVLMILSLVIFILYYLLRIFSIKYSSLFVMRCTKIWAGHILAVAGIKIYVNGYENVPQEDNVCFVSNHQSYLDIPVIYAVIPKQVGFVAKKELDKIPLLNLWMRALGCVLIDRKKPSSSLQKTRKRIDKVEKGRPLVIFPEGTRSKDNRVGKFKTGSIQIMAGKNIKIVPVTIMNTHKLLEKDNAVRKGEVYVYIHPPMQHKNKNGKSMATDLEHIVGSVFNA